MDHADRLLSRDRHRGCLLGLAIGDALGAQVEFKPRGSFPFVYDLQGGGPHRMPPGGWTDDTSMALALGESLATCKRFNAYDQAERYIRWWLRGEYSHTGTCFDIGIQTSTSLAAIHRSWSVRGTVDVRERAAGNGCVMRLGPVPMRYASREDLTISNSVKSALVTHRSPLCAAGSAWFGRLVRDALLGLTRDEILERATTRTGLSYWMHDVQDADRPTFARLLDPDLPKLRPEQVRSSGFVIDTLEAALWCFARTSTFRTAVLMAANLGDDADTVAAVTGQLAGAFYGYEAIPESWRVLVAWSDRLVSTADKLYALAAEDAHSTLPVRA